ncbi:MAG: DNA methyltransferase [Candidatus Magasanikbacteria bacterium]
MQYIFELGHQPHISTAEVLSILKREKIKYKTIDTKNDYFILDVDSTEEKIEKISQDFGGIIQVGVKFESLEFPQKIIVDYLQTKENGKINFSISPTNSKLAINIKKELKSLGKSVRYVETKNTASILHNKLIESKSHFTVFQNNVYKTIYIQDIEGFTERDYYRPVSDNISGMLPPKLSRTMINLSGCKKKSTIFDPFCGSGTILNEAISLGFKDIIGSDNSQKAIDDSKKNIDWLIEKNNLKNIKTNIFLAKTTDLTNHLKPQSIDLIVAEPYMGKPLYGKEPRGFLEAQAQNLAQLYIDSFQTFHQILKADATVIFIIPKFKFDNIWISVRCLDEIKKLGFEITNFENGERSLLYHRPAQFVGREIWKFKKV